MRGTPQICLKMVASQVKSTTLLAFIVIQTLWQWSKYTSMAFLSVFLTVDFTFLSSNSLKIPTGGWLPLVVGTLLFLVMTTWIKGRALLSEYLDERRVLFEDLEEKIKCCCTTLHTIIHYMSELLCCPLLPRTTPMLTKSTWSKSGPSVKTGIFTG